MGMEVTYMDRKRELVLQRLSRIDSLSVSSYVAENEKFKGQPVGTMSIEAAIGTYIMTNQMADYMSVLEESRIISIKKGIDVVKDNTDDNITDLQDLSKANKKGNFLSKIAFNFNFTVFFLLLPEYRGKQKA